VTQSLENTSAQRNKISRVGDDSKTELRKKLLRRLIWKAPLICLLVLFAVWWQARSERGTQPSSSPDSKAALFTGNWNGEVIYPSGDKYNEEFFFQPEGEKLFGTVSFLGAKHGVQDGRLEGDRISFFIRFDDRSGERTVEHKVYYWGQIAGGRLAMRLQDSRGNSPVDFVLKKSGAPR
jgi:hypothetical protein